MKFLKYLLLNFRIYQFCGFAPFSIQLDTKTQTLRKQWKWYIYSGILIIPVISMVFYNIIAYSAFLNKETAQMSTYLSFFMFIANRIALAIILIESLFKLKIQTDFLQCLVDVDKIFHDELGISVDYKKMRRNVFIWTSIWFIQSVVIWVLILISISSRDISTWEKIKNTIFSLPMSMLAIRSMQIVHYIYLLGLCFELINM